jgi:hypothetical protein
LQENSNGTLVLTPTNLPPEESILRCSLKFPDKMTPKIFFATSITIESLKGGRQDQELTKTESGVEHYTDETEEKEQSRNEEALPTV